MERYPLVLMLAGIVGMAALFGLSPMAGMQGVTECTPNGFHLPEGGVCCEGLERAEYTEFLEDGSTRIGFVCVLGPGAPTGDRECAGVGEGIFFTEDTECCEGLVGVMTSRSTTHCIYPLDSGTRPL